MPIGKCERCGEPWDTADHAASCWPGLCRPCRTIEGWKWERLKKQSEVDSLATLIELAERVRPAQSRFTSRAPATKRRK